MVTINSTLSYDVSRPILVIYIKSVAMMYKRPVTLVGVNPMTIT